MALLVDVNSLFNNKHNEMIYLNESSRFLRFLIFYFYFRFVKKGPVEHK